MQVVDTASAVPCLLGIEGDAQNARARFNRMSFELSHHLSDHPLFELPALLRLAKTMAKIDLHFDAGDIKIGQRWSEIPPCDQPLEHLLDRIENAGAWIVLRRVQKYDPYREIVFKILDEWLSSIDESITRHIRKREAVLFVTSPNRIATYHIDRECSLLLQIRGEKSISVFDKSDREVLPEEELERFWSVDANAPTYREQYQDRADVYTLKPGVGVHIPVNAPHWVKNHDNVSISLNVNIQFDDKTAASIYKANHYLRKLGLAPTPPGLSKVRDSLKAASMSCAAGLVRRLKRVGGTFSGRRHSS
jgi:hypothetical protein